MFSASPFGKGGLRGNGTYLRIFSLKINIID
jgi:hypothetical protein